MKNISSPSSSSTSSSSTFLQTLESKQPCSSLDINLDILITIRKGVRTYTQHPLANFISFYQLKSTYKAFTTNLSLEPIPNIIKEALLDPRWKEAVFDEMSVLHKNDT